jgi:type I restriction-modification system DNA methylase subunit
VSKHSDIKKSLEEIFTEVQSKPEMNEDTLRINFAKKKILENLGYTKNEIFYEERLSTAKRTDIHCTDEFGDVVFIIEFKNPKIENLKQFEDDLWKKYIKPLKAKHGLLYNGKEILFYERKRNQLQKISNVSGKIPDLDDNKISKIIQYLEKPDYGTTLIKNVTDYLNKFKDIDERLALEEEISREHFYESFKLKKDSIFTSLVCSIIDLFQDELKQKDKSFTRSAYDFWKKSYAKSLAKSQVPDNWKPVFKETSLSIGKEEDRYVMMFCLETAFALFMRLILTKSCEDFGFPDARFSDFLENEIKKASRSNRDIAQASYPKIAMEIIRDMKDRLISSVFEEDIFYWWTGEFDKRSYQRFFQDSTLQMGKFGRNVAKLLMSIYKFDFSKIEGDPLGVLYQQYFDTETRKALGEFYTPLEIVNYILDSVDYNGQKIINQRLLDPACGSGTFLVEALRRYLENSSRKANQVGWSKVLDDLCNEYLIVGFDIHPFATIMSQVQFTLALLPKYKLAKDKDPSFVLSRLPIFRTDSLSKEKQSGEMKIEEWGEGTAFTIKIELPVQK